MKNLILSLVVVCITGCASVKPGNDPLIVHASQSKKILVETANTFVALEKNNRDYFWSVSKSIKKSADGVRLAVPDIIFSLDKSVDRYRAYKTSNDRIDLETQIGIVTTTIADITTVYLTTKEALKSK